MNTKRWWIRLRAETLHNRLRSFTRNSLSRKLNSSLQSQQLHMLRLLHTTLTKEDSTTSPTTHAVEDTVEIKHGNSSSSARHLNKPHSPTPHVVTKGVVKYVASMVIVLDDALNTHVRRTTSPSAAICASASVCTSGSTMATESQLRCEYSVQHDTLAHR